MKDAKKWVFLTNHAMVLKHVARVPSTTGLELSETIGIQERSVRRIIADLIEAGYVSVVKEGRRNRYVIREDMPLRRPSNQATEVGELLRVLNTEGRKRSSRRSEKSG